MTLKFVGYKKGGARGKFKAIFTYKQKRRKAKLVSKHLI